MPCACVRSRKCRSRPLSDVARSLPPSCACAGALRCERPNQLLVQKCSSSSQPPRLFRCFAIQPSFDNKKERSFAAMRAGETEMNIFNSKCVPRRFRFVQRRHPRPVALFSFSFFVGLSSFHSSVCFMKITCSLQFDASFRNLREHRQ